MLPTSNLSANSPRNTRPQMSVVSPRTSPAHIYIFIVHPKLLYHTKPSLAYLGYPALPSLIPNNGGRNSGGRNNEVTPRTNLTFQSRQFSDLNVAYICVSSAVTGWAQRSRHTWDTRKRPTSYLAIPDYFPICIGIITFMLLTFRSVFHSF